ncbi:HAMP domain-containing sensor histidine kinase [Flavobacterium hauense]
MKIKTKLIIAVSLLFLMITVLSAIGIRQVNVLAGETKNILTDNYHSLDYSRNMYKILDGEQAEPNLARFKEYLEKQQQNVTEVGEKELTDDLLQDFTALEKDPKNTVLQQKVRTDLNSIMKLNMDSIQRKSDGAAKTADSSIMWMSLVSSFCFIIGFTLIVNLPGYIANPIRDLTESIRQIAAKNYSQRIYFKGHTEFTDLAKSFNTMAEKLQEYSATNIEKLMMEKKRVETLINNLNDPILGLDENNRILFINEEALKISGLKKEEVIGKDANEIALHNDLVRKLLQRASKSSQNEDTLKIYADNKESYFEKLAVPIFITPTGETETRQAGSFIILRNVTAYKELDFAKTNFIATVSHEFKTPIAAMKMSLQLLENEKMGMLNEEQKNLVDSIKDDTNRLLRTTGELLNITQVETGKTGLNMASCDAFLLINEAVESNKIAAAAKNILVETVIPDALPEILADAEKTTWVISNLISNAIRYSYENSKVEISAVILPKRIEIIVKDTGIGIPEKYLDKVFDKYFRVPGNQKEGTGLGLAISREFMAAQGGSISVESNPGEGSRFMVNFKRAY